MVRNYVRLFVALFLIALGAGWFLTAPDKLPHGALERLEPDPERGRWVFYAGGCASCHSAPRAEGDDKLILSGGRAFKSDFGTFFAPNISSDVQQGIGGWSAEDLANAMLFGTGPSGQHYYPAFPYTSYARAELGDIVALHAFLQSLPASETPSQPHDVSFPFNIRRSLGGWKQLFARTGWVIEGELSDLERRGRYLVEGLGHCGECHTPRNALGGLDYDRWLGGAPVPGGKGRVPNLTPAKLNWSVNDIAEYLRSGFTPEFDTAGGEMAAVVENTSQLTDEDRAAIAAYLKIVPAVE